MCSAAALLAVQTVQAQPPENGQSGQSSQGDIAYVKMSNTRSSADRAGSHRAEVMFTLSGLEDVVFNDFIQDDFIQKVMVKSRQVLHPS